MASKQFQSNLTDGSLTRRVAVKAEEMPEKTSNNPLERAPTREEFEQAVRRGLGRAVLWLSQGFAADREFLLHACTHDFSYDSIEDNRALYMFDVIRATEDKDYYTRSLERALMEIWDDTEESEEPDSEEKAEKDDRSVSQIFDLLGLLAKDGDMAARRSLYAFFEKYAEASWLSWAEVLVDLDGLEGYLSVIRQWIQHPRDEDNHWYEVALLEDLEERFGVEEVQAFLEGATVAEPTIGAYISEVRARWAVRDQNRKKRLPPLPDAAELRRLIADLGKHFNRPRAAHAGDKLSEADAEQMAREMLAETDLGRLERYLWLFRRRPFPLDHTPLLTLAWDAEPEVATGARAALCRVKHPSVRMLALEGVDADPRPWEWVEMLTLNFEEGDEKVIERLLKKPWDDEGMHSLGLALRTVFEENLTPVASDALLLFYELGYCTWCREGAIELLSKLGPLPDYLIAECRFDAYDSTREIMQAIADKGTEPKA